MTREEAIKHINGVRLFLLALNKPIDEYMVALDMAIAALEQEPCDDCKYKMFTNLYFHTDPEMAEQQPRDTISREEVLNLLDKERDEYTIQKVKKLPSVQPIQKTNYYGVKNVLLSEDNK